MKNFLEEEEKKELKSQHRSERDGKIRDRIKVVLAMNDGWQLKEIAKVLLLDKETIRRHLKDYLESRKIKNGSGGSDGKIHKSQIKYGINYSVPGITAWLKNNGFSYKKPKGFDKIIPTTTLRTRVNLMGSINLKTMDVSIESYQTINSDSNHSN